MTGAVGGLPIGAFGSKTVVPGYVTAGNVVVGGTAVVPGSTVISATSIVAGPLDMATSVGAGSPGFDAKTADSVVLSFGTDSVEAGAAAKDAAGAPEGDSPTSPDPHEAIPTIAKNAQPVPQHTDRTPDRVLPFRVTH